MKTANIQVYGNIVLYIDIALSAYKTDYALRCLECMCTVSSPFKDATGSGWARSLIGLLIVKKLINVLLNVT